MTLRRLLGGIRRRAQRLVPLLGRVEKLESLAPLTQFCRNVDLTRTGDFFLFMYEDDIPWQYNWGGHHQHRRLSPAAIQAEVDLVRNSSARRHLHDYDPVATAILGLSKCGQPFNLFYVGVNYGTHLFNLADYVRKSGYDCRICAFDPGVASALTPMNIEINGFSDLIRFFAVAVSDADSLTVMSHKIGWSWSNQLANDQDGDLRVAKAVRTRTIDSLAAELGLFGPTILVVDTEGHEPEVLAGATGYMAANPWVLFAEYAPCVHWLRGEPETFLRRLISLGDTYDISPLVDSGAMDQPSPETRAALLVEQARLDNLVEFAQRIDESKLRWTDLMVIPREGDVAALVRGEFGLSE